MNALGNCPQALGAVVDPVHRRDIGEERLRRADVRRRPFTPDVLFARSERHPIRGVPVGIDRHANDATRHLAYIRRARGEECRMGAAVPQRHAESLRVSEHHIRPHLARRREDREREKIGADCNENTGLVRPLDERPQVLHGSDLVRILDQYAKGDGAAARLEQHGVVGHHLDVDVERRRAAAQHVDRLWKTAVAYQEHAARIAIACRRCRRMLRLCGAHTVQQRHRFRRGRRLVEQRGIRHLHAREVGDHCLEVQEGFETALRDLRLIWRVRRMPTRILEHHAQDDAWRNRVVIAEANVGAEYLVVAGDAGETPQVLMLAFRLRQSERLR